MPKFWHLLSAKELPVTRPTLFALLTLLFVALETRAQQSAGPVLVLHGATVIDGTGGPARPNRSIVIRSGRIAAVTAADAPLPAGAQVIELRGRYVIPGLVDAHVHVTSPFVNPLQQDSMLAFLFNSGITTVRDLAGDAIVLAERARLASDPQLPSPRVYYSALMAGPEFLRTEPRAVPIARGGKPGEMPWLRSLTDSTDIQRAVAAAKQVGATGIKLYADLPAHLVQVVTAEGHRQGLRVWSHATLAPAKPSDAIAAGVDVLSHLDMLVFEAEPTLTGSIRTIRLRPSYAAAPVNGPLMTTLLQTMKAKGTLLDATLFALNSAGQRAEADESRPQLQPMREWGFALARRAHELGVPFVAGTDLMGRPSVDAVAYLHDELELLVSRAGLTPLEAIRAATLNGALALGRAREQGTIEPGKLADLVVLSADPVTDIRNTRRIAFIVKGGQVHEPALAKFIGQLGTSRGESSEATLVWTESWPGTQFARVSGDPSAAGKEFRFRFRMPADYWIPPHTHAGRATIRVLSGEFRVGMGEQIEEANARSYAAGETAVIESGMAHFEATRGETVIEVSGIGPWTIKFLDPGAAPFVRRR